VALAATATAVVALAAAAGTSTAARPSKAPCTPTPVTIKGNAGLSLCGPATATLTVGGKTYTFHNGYGAEPIANSDSFQLTLGFDVPAFGGPNENGGKPGFSLDIVKHHTSAAVAFAYSGGHELVKLARVTLKGAVPAPGTFRGKTSAFTGSWNCHGVISKS